MNKVVFQILWTILRLFIWGVAEVFLISHSQLFIKKKSPSQMKIDEEHLFEEQLVGCSSPNSTQRLLQMETDYLD